METRQPINLIDANVSEKMKTFLSFVNLIETGVTDSKAYEAFLHKEVEFYEYPNLITKQGQVRNFFAALKGVEAGKNLMAEHSYKYLDWFELDEKLVIESLWTGTIAMDVAHLKKGDQLKAHICMIIYFKEGKIIRQRNYDCYEPF